MAKVTRRDSTTFGVDTVEPGNPDIANQLRQVFDVHTRFPVDVSTTIVPVAMVAGAGGVRATAGGSGGVYHNYADGTGVAGIVNMGASRVFVRDLGIYGTHAIIRIEPLSAIPNLTDLVLSEPLSRGPTTAKMFTGLRTAVVPPENAMGVLGQLDNAIWTVPQADASFYPTRFDPFELRAGEALTVSVTGGSFMIVNLNFDEV